MNYCDKFKESFSEYIEEELNTDTRQVIESHLSICPGCRETVNRMQSVRGSLNQLPRFSTSPDFELKLTRRLRQLDNQRIFPFPLNYFQDWKVPAVSFAVILMVFSFFMFYDNGPVEMNVNTPQQSGMKATFPGEDEQKGTSEDTSTIQETAPAMVNTTSDSVNQDARRNLKDEIKRVNQKTVEK
jgi:hypothetical protein